MASDGRNIHRSKVLKHPLTGGQAGLLRESGLIKTSSIFDAWSKGLDERVLRRPKAGSTTMEYTSLIHDETMQRTILGSKDQYHGDHDDDEIAM